MGAKSHHKFRKPLLWRMLVVFLVLSGTAHAHKTEVYGGTGCIAPQGLEIQLNQTLNQFAPSRADTQNLTARISLSLTGDNLALSMKLMDASNQVALTRRYQLHRQDCPDVPALLQLVLEEFLREFPENPWRAEVVDIETKDNDISHLENDKIGIRGGFGVLGNLAPGGATLEGNLHLQAQLTGPAQWLLGLHLRASLPQQAWEGDYQTFGVLLGLGTTLTAWHTQWDVECLGGITIVQGDSFLENRSAFAPVIEFNMGARWYWNQFSIGPRLGLGLLRHSVQVLPSEQQTNISILNMGLALQYDMI